MYDQKLTPAPDREIDLDEWDGIVADKYKVPRNLMKAMASQESGGNVNAVSPTGVKGRYQVTQKAAGKYGLNRDDPFQQSVAAARYLRDEFDSLKDIKDDNERWLGAVGKYYAGGNAVDPKTGELSTGSVDGVSNPTEHVTRVAKKWGNFNRGGEQALMPAQPAMPTAPKAPTKPLRKPNTTSPFSFDAPTGFATAERAVSNIDISPEAQAQANKQNQAYTNYSQKGLGGRLREDATVAAARAGEWAQQTGQRTIGTVLGLAKGATNPQLGFAPIDIRTAAGKAAQEATAQRLAEREAAAPDPSSKIRRGLVQGALQAPVYAAAAEAGGLPALAALNVAQEDFKDPLRSGARAIANTVVPLAGGKLGQMAVSPLARGLAPGANAATRYAGEAVGGAATNVAQTAAEQRIFDGKVDPRELVSQAVIGGVLSPAMARQGVRGAVAADQARLAPPPPPAPPLAPPRARPQNMRMAPPPVTEPLAAVLPIPKPRRNIPQPRQVQTEPLTEPFTPDAPATTRIPEGAPVGAETTRTTAPEQARTPAPDEISIESPQQKRNRLITANKQRADAAGEAYRKAFESGDYDQAERSLLEQKRYLSDIKSQIGNKAKTPGDSAVRARIDGDLGAIGNRMGEVRKARRGAIMEGNKPTKDISTPLAENAPETTRVPSEPIQDTTLIPPPSRVTVPETRRVTSEQDLPTRDLTQDELLAPTERELAPQAELAPTAELAPRPAPLARIGDQPRVLKGGGPTETISPRSTERLRPAPRVPEANTSNIKALESRYENVTRTINERPDSVSQDLRDYRRELGAAIGEYKRANQSADSRALRNLPRPSPEQLVKQGQRDAEAASVAREFFRNAKPPETGPLPAEAPPRPQEAPPLDTTQPERMPSKPLGMENEISQAERDAIQRRISRMNPAQLDAALRDAEAARNEDIAKPQMSGMSRRLAGAYRDALNERRKELVKGKELPAKAPLSQDESVGLKWARDEEFGAEARAFKQEFGRWPEDLSELQSGAPKKTQDSGPTIQHERFGEVKVIEKAPSGKLVVEDADGNSHTIQNPRTTGNRSAAYAKKALTEELPMPVAEQMGTLSESAVGGKSTPLAKPATDRLASMDAPIKQDWLIKGGANPDLYGARTLQELFKLPGGRQWWEENGRKFESQLDLKPKKTTAELNAEKAAAEAEQEMLKGIDPVNDPQGWRDFLRSIRDKKSEPRSKTVTGYGKEASGKANEIIKKWDQVRENISTLESKLRKAKKGTPKRAEIEGKLSELKQKDSELEASYRTADAELLETKSETEASLPGKNILSARFMPGSKGRQGNLYLSEEVFTRLSPDSKDAGGISINKRSVEGFLRSEGKSLTPTERTMIASALSEANRLGSGKVSVTRLGKDERQPSLGRTKTVSRHESVHSAQPLPERHPDVYRSLETQYGAVGSESGRKIVAALRSSDTYKNSTTGDLLTTEGPAFIGSGDAKRVGLTEAEGEAFYQDYLDRVYQTGGFEPLMDLALQSRPTPKYAKMMAERLQWAAENEKGKNFPTTKPAIVERAEVRLREIAAGRRAGSGVEALFDQAIVTGYKVYKSGMDFVQWSQAVVKDAGDSIRPQLRKAWEELTSNTQGALEEATSRQSDRIDELGEGLANKRTRLDELKQSRQTLDAEKSMMEAAGKDAGAVSSLRKDYRKDEVRMESRLANAASERRALLRSQQGLEPGKEITQGRSSQEKASAKSERVQELEASRKALETERKALLGDEARLKAQGKPVPDALRKAIERNTADARQNRKDLIRNRVLGGIKEFYKDEGGSAKAGFDPSPRAGQKPVSATPLPAGLARQRAIAQGRKASPASNLSSITAESLKQGTPGVKPTPPATKRAAPESAEAYFQEQLAKSPWKEPKAAIRDTANEEARSALKVAADRMARGKMKDEQKESIVSAADDLMLAGRLGDEKAIGEARRKLADATRSDQGNLRKAAGSVGRGIKESASFLQTLRYGTDLSFAFRQAAPLTTNAGNIVNTLRAFKHAYHALGRETGEGFTVAPGSKGAESVRKLLESHPRRELAEKAGIELSGTSGPEEMFSSNAAMKIPWIKRTEAANAAFIDYMRLQEFDTFAKRIEASNQSEFQKNEGYKRAAEVINTLTGRTDLGEGKLKQIASAANGIAAAPRLSISRIKQLDPTWIVREWRKNPEVGKQMARQMVGIGSTWGSLLALGAASGAFSVVLDPRDKDFGKIVSGDTRYDITGGALAPAKLMGEIGDFMWQAGKEVIDSNPNTTKDRKKAQADMVYRVKQYLRGRLGPAASYVADLAVYGEDYDRNPVTPKSVLTDYKNPSFAPRRLLLPLGVEGPIENVQKGRGLKDIAKTTPFEFFGVGARNYDKRNGDLDRESDFIRESSGMGLDFRNLEKKKGEPEELYKARTERVNKWLESEGSKLVNSTEYKNANSEQKEKMLRALKGRATQQSNLKAPNTSAFAPSAILRSVRQGERRERRNRGRLIFAGEEE
jgi:hypothetical protein